jgi:hypothetical protein
LRLGSTSNEVQTTITGSTFDNNCAVSGGSLFC